MAVHLVLRALGLGDLLTGIPALRALRRAHPTDQLLLAAPRALEPLVRLTGAVDHLVPTAGLSQFGDDIRRYRHRFDHGRHRARQDDQDDELDDHAGGDDQPAPDPPHDQLQDVHAVNLHGSGPQSIDCLLSLDPQDLISHSHPARPAVPGPQWNGELHEIDRWCSLLEWFGIPADRSDLALIRPRVPSPSVGATVIHPGASFRSRRWPEARFAEVARVLAREGHRIVITGTPAERALCCRTAERAGLPRRVVLAGHTDLEQLAAVVADAQLVICGDTGVGHLATALNTRSVLLFGPTPPDRWGPTVHSARHVVLWAGRVGDPLCHRRDAGLLRLRVDDVVDGAHRVLEAA